MSEKAHWAARERALLSQVDELNSKLRQSENANAQLEEHLQTKVWVARVLLCNQQQYSLEW
jgi:hypothetical protein